MVDVPEHDDRASDPAAAFEALREEVAALRQAIDAGGQAVPDYSPDLGRIVQELNQVDATLAAIEQHPALQLTPAQFGQAMTHAGRELMNEVAQKYERARQDAERERHQLAGMISTVRAKRNQTFWLIALPAAVFAFTLLASPVLLGELPFGWNTDAAATVMHNDRWDAGGALMQAANAQGWNDLVAASALVRANHDTLAACQQAADNDGKDRRCTIVVKVQ